MAVGFFGFAELLLIVMGGGVFSSGALGLPPGERDAALVRCAPADALLYSEWSERGSGEAGAPGVDGLAADPEILAFLAAAEKAILTTIDTATQNEGREAQIAGKNIPPLVKLLVSRPGCLYLAFDEQARPLDVPEGRIPDPAEIVMSGAKAALVVSGGDDADTIAKHIEALVELLPEDIRTRGLDRQPLPMPMPGLQLVLHRHDDYFILGFGAGTVDNVVAGLQGDEQGLAGNERFQSALERVAVERPAALSWVDLQTVRAKVQAVLGPQGEIVPAMARTLGLDALDSVASMTGVEEGDVVTRSFVNTGGSTRGVLAFAAGRGIQPDDFNHVPQDADLVFAVSLSPEKILAAAKQVVSEAHPPSGERFEQILDQLETELGVSFEDELFPAFGDVWTLYDSPSAGGVLLTSGVATLEVRDEEQARAVFTKLMKIMEQAVTYERGQFGRRRGMSLEHQEFMGTEIYYINAVGEDMPMAPAFCVTENHLLAALHPQALKAHLRFAGSDDANFSKSVPSAAGGDLLCYSYVDAARATQLFYAFVPYWGQMVYSEIQREGVEIDIFTLPSARAILPYVGESTSTVLRTEDGILSESRRGLPLPGGSGLLLNVPLMFGFMLPVRAMHMEAVPAIEVDEAINALPPGGPRQRGTLHPRPRVLDTEQEAAARQTAQRSAARTLIS